MLTNLQRSNHQQLLRQLGQQPWVGRTISKCPAERKAVAVSWHFQPIVILQHLDKTCVRKFFNQKTLVSQ